MGVDLYRSSMSYQRYDDLIVVIAKFFGAKENIYISPKDGMYGFGYLNIGKNKKIKNKFTFPKKTNYHLKFWCNNPYGEKDRKTVSKFYELLILHQDQIEMFDDWTLRQFLSDLKQCIEENGRWVAY
jgi:hypothetical protein